MEHVLKHSRLANAINQCHYSFEQYIVVRHDPLHQFFVWPRENIEQLVVQQINSLHEIVPVNCPCRLFFDIDFYLNEKQNTTFIYSILKDFCEGLEIALKNLASKTNEPINVNPYQMHVLLAIDDEVERGVPEILELHGIAATRHKCGMHVIVPDVVFADISNMQIFVEEFISILNFGDIYDCAVYRQNTSLRLFYCPKAQGAARPLIPLSLQKAQQMGLDALCHPIIGVMDNWLITPRPDQIPLVYRQQFTSKPTRIDEREMVLITNAQAIYDFLVERELFANVFVPQTPIKNLTHLRRIAPGFCKICDREHSSENAWFAVWSLGERFYVVIGCYRNKNYQSINLPEHMIGYCSYFNGKENDWFDLDSNEVVSETCKQLTSDLPFCDNLDDEITLWYKYTRFISEQNLPLISLEGIRPGYNIFIIGGMGTGKTEALCRLVGNLLLEDENASFLIVTSRRTLTAKLLSDYACHDFQAYWNLQGPIVATRVIVQVESLARIDSKKKNYQYIIIDEAISVLKQFSCKMHSSLTKLPISGFQTLFILLQLASNVFIMDAYADLSWFAVFQTIYARPLQIFVNKYQAMLNLSVEFFDSLSAGVMHLINNLQFLQQDEHIFIVVEKRCLAILLGQFVIHQFAELSLRVITGDTDDQEKEKVFSSVNERLTENVIIYTNVVSAGVSYIHPTIALYGFITGRVLHARDVLQMMGRARNCKQWFITITKKENEKFIDSQNNIFRIAYSEIISRPLVYQLARIGGRVSIQRFKESFLVVALYNAALVIEGKNILQTSLKRLLARYGCKILVGDNTQKCLLFMLFSKNYRLELKLSYAEKLAIAFSSNYDIEELMMRAKTGIALNEGEKKAIEAHQIVVDYCYEGRVSPEFFLNYGSKNMRPLWQRVQYSLTHPNGPFISSEAEKKEGIHFLQLMNEEWSIKDQAFFAHGHLNFKQLRAGYELAAFFGFGSLWQWEGDNTMASKKTIVQQRLNLVHLLSYIMPPIYNRPLTDVEFWKIINSALYKSLGLRLLSNATILHASWPTKFGYVILQPEAFQLGTSLNLVIPTAIKELHFPVIII